MAHKQQTKEVRLRAVPEEVLRIAKSKAALLGQTLETYLTQLIKRVHKENL
jgi:hypothetical protein